MGKNFRETLNEQLKDPEFKIEYDALSAEYQLINAILDARKAANITQKQLAEKTGIAQSDISKIENGNANPSLKTIERIASGMGMTVRVEFVPAKQTK
jgi:DNA-binding XRE family transcriptional regulator